jgi:hypothetical protein
VEIEQGTWQNSHKTDRQTILLHKPLVFMSGSIIVSSLCLTLSRRVCSFPAWHPGGWQFFV